MKVAQFNTFPYGGAATAATRLHQQLGQRGVESRFFYHRNEKGSLPAADGFEQIEFPVSNYRGFSGAVQRRKDKRRQREVYRQYNEHIALRPPNQETFSMAQLPQSTPLDWSTIAADVAHLHWISFFADYPTFFRSIPDTVPIVWTLHDMNAFTGGCHYANGCNRFRFGCGGCPQITNRGPADVSRSTLDVKRRALQGKTIEVVTPSDWMRELAESSDVWPAETSFQTIRLGFDLELFRPSDRAAARAALGVSQDAVLIGFGAEDINNRRKGLHHLLESLKHFRRSAGANRQPVECLMFGSGEIADRSDLPEIHSLGYVDSAEQQALVYAACDLVVVPSREDNSPQVGLEAMACGVPVVAFDAGGIPEYVIDGETGLLASVGDEADLAAKISLMVANEAMRRQMGIAGRSLLEREFDLGQQSAKYFELYQNAVETMASCRSVVARAA